MNFLGNDAKETANLMLPSNEKLSSLILHPIVTEFDIMSDKNSFEQ